MYAAQHSKPPLQHVNVVDHVLRIGILLVALLEAWGDRWTVLDEDGEPTGWPLVMM